MVGPFKKSKRHEKLEALECMMAEQKAAAMRLQENLRAAQSARVMEVLMAAVPNHEGGDK